MIDKKVIRDASVAHLEIIDGLTNFDKTIDMVKNTREIKYVVILF